MATLNINPNSLHSDGYVVDLGNGKSLLKRDRIDYNPVVAKDRLYIVKEGDSIWDIAYQFYGNSKAKAWRLIADANKIFNPFELEIGSQLIIPDPQSVDNT